METYLAGRIIEGRRLPIAAGLFYEARAEKLKAQMEWATRHPLGPGNVEPRGDVVAVVSPHGGYFYAGPLYAWAFSVIPGSWDTVVVVGPNHTGVGPAVSVYPRGSWVTPLGEVLVDEEFSSRLASRAGAVLDYVAHLYEHSVEVVLPWLQHRLEQGWRLVAVSLFEQEPSTVARLAGAVLSVAEELGRRTLVVASANLSAYLGYEEARQKDQLLVERLVSGRLGDVYRTVVDERIPTCSAGVLEFFAEYARLRGAGVEVLRYATSGDVSGEKEVVTGYLAAAAAMGGRG